MKRHMPVFMAIIIGMIFGNLIFDSYETETVMTSDGNVYMLQYGAYTSESVMQENVKNLDKNAYIVVIQEKVYYVYLAITTNYYNALNIKEHYNDEDIFLYIKENYLGNSELINKIKNIDNLLKDESNREDIFYYAKESLNLYKKYY